MPRLRVYLWCLAVVAGAFIARARTSPLELVETSAAALPQGGQGGCDGKGTQPWCADCVDNDCKAVCVGYDHCAMDLVPKPKPRLVCHPIEPRCASGRHKFGTTAASSGSPEQEYLDNFLASVIDPSLKQCLDGADLSGGVATFRIAFSQVDGRLIAGADKESLQLMESANLDEKQQALLVGCMQKATMGAVIEDPAQVGAKQDFVAYGEWEF